MKQKITGDIDSTYRAQAHSLETLQKWHNDKPFISQILLSSEVVFPVVVMIFLALYCYYLFELEPNKIRKTLDKHIETESREISNDAKATVWITLTISLLFNIGTVAADIAAQKYYYLLPSEVSIFVSNTNASSNLKAVPKIMLAFDSFILILLLLLLLYTLIVYGITSLLQYCNTEHDCSTSQIKLSYFLYSVLCPPACIATHSYHIIFSFINNTYHATSVLLCYIMTFFVLVVIFNKIYYLISHRISQSFQGLCTIIFYILSSFAIATLLGLTVAILLILPITNAVDEASNQIYSIYQASVAVFAALVTWKLFSRDTNYVFSVFIKAEEKRNPNRESWKNMSDKEKEIELGIMFLNYINSDIKRRSDTQSISLASSARVNTISDTEATVTDSTPSDALTGNGQRLRPLTSRPKPTSEAKSE